MKDQFLAEIVNSLDKLVKIKAMQTEILIDINREELDSKALKADLSKIVNEKVTYTCY